MESAAPCRRTLWCAASNLDRRLSGGWRRCLYSGCASQQPQVQALAAANELRADDGSDNSGKSAWREQSVDIGHAHFVKKDAAAGSEKNMQQVNCKRVGAYIGEGT